MPRSSFVDFKAVKAAITMEQLLQHYNILDSFKRSGDTLSGPCPIHGGSNPSQFRVSTSKNLWNCFSECKHGGNTLDFIAKKEKISIHAAALKAIEWFKLDPKQMASESPSEEEPDEPEPEKVVAFPGKDTPKKAATPEPATPNPPLKFKLDKLDREHPYLKERGLTLETIIDFGVGFCAKGVMADRIAIPIHNVEGKVVAYAGRWPGESSGDVPKYKLPQGFKKSLELFNFDRALEEPIEDPLIIVEGFFACMKLHQLGYRKVIALMGSSLSDAQEQLILNHTHLKTRVIVILDEDEAGRTGRQDIAVRLSRSMFVRVFSIPEEGWQAEQLTEEDLEELLE